MASAQISVVVLSKDEPELATTLALLEKQDLDASFEVVVVDASEGRLDHVRDDHPTVRWVPFAPRQKAITIAEQRNVGVAEAASDVIVFTDAGCEPEQDWLDLLTAPILGGGERATAGRTTWGGAGSVYLDTAEQGPDYLDEAPTINLAFTRDAFDAVGGFDEDFDYGSDVDYTWRLRHAGIGVRNVPSAWVRARTGGSRRQYRRAYLYGRARARLYLKHRDERRRMASRDPIMATYPLFLLALPLTLLRPFRWVPLLVLVPLWRNRQHHPFVTLADHLAYGAGAISFVVEEAVR